MVKEGPCCHCGITNTPLWRNGPPGKPVLCNACGSRWRTKGSLANYAPLHSRFPPPIDSYDHRTYREYKSPSNKKPKVLRIIKRAECAAEVGETVPGHYQCTIGSEDDVSNKSSSASEISFSSSCIQHGNVDGNDISGSAQSHLWDSHIPSRKRTGKKRQSPSPVEKLRRDLCDILQEQESSYPSGCSEELLFLEREEDPVVSIETGLGGFLIKQPIPSAEEESEASSLATETKISSSNDASMGSSSFDIHSRSYEINSSTACKHKINGNVQEAEKVKDNLSKCHDLANMHSNSLLLNSLGVLQNIHSPQSPIDIQPLTDESFTWERETSSCSSHIIGVGMSLPTDRPLNQKCCQISEGSKESLEAQNRGSINFHPSQASLGTDVDFITGPMSGEPNDQMLIGCPNSSTMFSASFPDRNSTMLDSMKADPVETLDKDFFISSPSNVACFPEGFL